VKNLLLSYCGFEIEMKGIPDKFKKEIETLIWDFIWEGKVNQIKRDVHVCCLDIENGGNEENIKGLFWKVILQFPNNLTCKISVLVSTFCKQVSLNFKSSLLNQYFPIAFLTVIQKCS
jgi:hypothetical protein